MGEAETDTTGSCDTTHKMTLVGSSWVRFRAVWLAAMAMAVWDVLSTMDHVAQQHPSNIHLLPFGTDALVGGAGIQRGRRPCKRMCKCPWAPTNIRERS